MKTSKKTQVIEEIIRPVKRRKMFSVSLSKNVERRIYVGDFLTIQEAHQEFHEYVKFMVMGQASLYKIKMDLRFDNFSFENPDSNLQRNLHGLAGVSKTRSGKFRAQMMVRGKRICLGFFDTPEKAHAAYMIAKQNSMFNPNDYSPFPFITKILERK